MIWYVVDLENLIKFCKVWGFNFCVYFKNIYEMVVVIKGLYVCKVNRYLKDVIVKK